MAWKIEFDSDVEKDLKKLGHTAQKRIFKFLKDKIMTSPYQDCLFTKMHSSLNVPVCAKYTSSLLAIPATVQ